MFSVLLSGVNGAQPFVCPSCPGPGATFPLSLRVLMVGTTLRTHRAWGYVSSRLLGFVPCGPLSVREGRSVNSHRCPHPQCSTAGFAAFYVFLAALYGTPNPNRFISLLFFALSCGCGIGYKLIIIFICLYLCHVHFPYFMI